eukprot:9491959-Pyramimonas_sp.AAC.1
MATIFKLSKKTLFKLDGTKLEKLAEKLLTKSKAATDNIDLFDRNEPHDFTSKLEMAAKKVQLYIHEAQFLLGWDQFKLDEVGLHKFAKKLDKDMREWTFRNVKIGLQFESPLDLRLKEIVEMA